MIYITQIPVPYLVKKFINWLENPEDTNMLDGLFYSGMIGLMNYGLPLFDGLCDNFYYKLGIVCEANFKVIISFIYFSHIYLGFYLG